MQTHLGVNGQIEMQLSAKDDIKECNKKKVCGSMLFSEIRKYPYIVK